MSSLRNTNKYILIIFNLFIICCLASCGFSTVHLSLKDENITDTVVTFTEGYYLNKNGVLYSPGADSDASSFVCYKNKEKGIVAENVADFGTMLCGGYCITNDNELLLWNRDKLPFYNYKNNKNLSKISTNITSAIATTESILFTDKSDKLYVAGVFENHTIKFNSPKLLDSNVACFSFYNSKPIWLKKNGEIYSFDCNTSQIDLIKKIDTASSELSSKNCKMQILPDNSIILLENNVLHFWGDYQKIIGNKASNSVQEMVLATNVETFSASDELIVAIDKENNAYAWGKCLSNDKSNTKTAEYTYYENRLVISNVNSVYVSSGSDLCFTDCNGKIKSFRKSDRWGFFGNSDNSDVVGINNDPVTWE